MALSFDVITIATIENVATATVTVVNVIVNAAAVNVYMLLILKLFVLICGVAVIVIITSDDVATATVVVTKVGSAFAFASFSVVVFDVVACTCGGQGDCDGVVGGCRAGGGKGRGGDEIAGSVVYITVPLFHDVGCR